MARKGGHVSATMSVGKAKSLEKGKGGKPNLDKVASKKKTGK